MNVTRKQERLLHRALSEWEQEGALTPEERQRLAGTLQRVTLDWQRLSRYAFWTALACVIIAIGSLFSDSAGTLAGNPDVIAVCRAGFCPQPAVST